MKVDCLIVGQGICGTFLSWYLEKAGLSFLVIDEPAKTAASPAAAGIINPVTGRRLVKTWMIDELIPFSTTAYQELGDALGVDCFSRVSLTDFFPSPQMRLAFLDRQRDDAEYLSLPDDENAWRDFFQYDFGFGLIKSCLLVDLPKLLPAYRLHLEKQGRIRSQPFSVDKLTINDSRIGYEDIDAGRLIFCDGVSSTTNPYFKNLPFAPNKGEALLLKIDGLPRNQLYKKGMTLVPWKDDLFWVGSSYEWSFDHDQPTEEFRLRTEAFLTQWLRMPFELVDHLAAVRPATLERRPFVGFHPTQKNIALLNGMGTKGCSLAPFFAHQLVGAITEGRPILPEANVQRFNRILSRS